MTTIRPKKALGQHFLIDDSIAARIADTLADYRGRPVLEVGPGTGVLTRHLLAAGHDLSVVEIDPASISFLRTHYPALEGRILDEDFLQMDLRTRYPSDFMVIGNYPYYISSQIFFKVLEERDRVVCCSGMIQKEVAERLVARPGSRIFGILSALIRPWYDVEYLFTVDEHVFNPPPKVKSGVIRLIRNERTDLGCSEALFKQVIKTGFNQRRKTLRNSLKALFGADYTGYTAEIFSKRPEQLGVEDFVTLTRLLEEHQAKASTKA